MSVIKISALTCSGFILWLAPPFILSRKIPLHNMTTGLALIGGFACCFEARRVAIKLSQAEDFEAMKEAVIVADTVDELATSAYISEQQRRMEAESILNVGSEAVEHLERALALTCEDESECERSEGKESNQLAKIDSERSENDKAERVLQLKAKGWGKAKIIFEIWGISKGGSAKYKAAEAEYKRLVGE
ncbi:MAG: hypothetical protein ACM65M_21090 [Microcoleus sp.]